LAGQLVLRGSRIVEHPATLSVRIFGESKMKTCRTIAGHVRLLTRLVRAKLRRKPGMPGLQSQMFKVQTPISNECPSSNVQGPEGEPPSA
jgi:hypothetical protein